ncbi:Rv1355c family protein [Mycolicibacterium arseniciresistens]|uniref:Rv1355c family protein n=1 Tax=Mycolicibacterium arseniciresistens TaxID=3062257 RepID=A0ABT8UC68_9MYCO|nr:Rv1355c family protein [Mycolicibacterium arseniciresistens]MDO3635379.1 Rv1355c family protein [Mycolicibacterium arseniciresistens]
MSVDDDGLNVYAAHLLDPEDSADRAMLDRLRADPRIEFLDRRAQQLDDLHRLRPAPDAAVLDEPGRWAYFPWRRSVAAVLGPKAFRAVRLDRNRNIITAAEQQRLGALRIGVAGLSVGHVIAHTLAAQGLCGRLHLADFDGLELSNLNRVPATVLDLGVNKAHVAARRIAEVDPYLPVRVFEAGLTSETVDEFLDGLDIVVEECDSLDMKAVLRLGARARGIPVVMATSDRGLIDIERFDLEPDRPILHGLLGELDVSLLPGMSSRDKVPHILRHLEASRLSSRTAASLVEVDRSISTWPQLAGDVALGATALAEAVRRIGLGEELRSGRVRIDVSGALDRLAEPEMARGAPEPPPEQGDTELPDLPGLTGVLAAAAIRAPSGGNVQPWRIDVTPDALTIGVATERTSAMDVGHRGSAVALGAALFNARVAAAAHDVLGPVTVTEHTGGVPLQATLRLGDRSDADLAELYRPMLARESNRHHGTPGPLDPATAEALHAIATRHGATLRLLTTDTELAGAAGILAAADRVRYLTPRLHAEMISELRWPGDPDFDEGIDVRSLEMDAGDLAVLDILRRPEVMAHLADWQAGSALGEDTHDRVRASCALAVVTVAGDALRDYASGGEAVEAVWIAAQTHGLGVQPVSPVFLYARSDDELRDLSPQFAGELAGLASDFARLAGTGPDDAIALILRLAATGPASVRSRRRLDRVRALSR